MEPPADVRGPPITPGWTVVSAATHGWPGSLRPPEKPRLGAA